MEPTRAAFEANLATYGLTDTVRLVADYSTRVRPGWDQPIDLLYVDGKHDYWTCSDDLRWAEHLRRRGTLLVHDAFSSVGVTLALLAHVLPSRHLATWAATGRWPGSGRLAPTAADRWRILGELPWWVRNLVVKVLLRLETRRLAAALGHDGDYDPY